MFHLVYLSWNQVILSQLRQSSWLFLVLHRRHFAWYLWQIPIFLFRRIYSSDFLRILLYVVFWLFFGLFWGYGYSFFLFTLELENKRIFLDISMVADSQIQAWLAWLSHKVVVVVIKYFSFQLHHSVPDLRLDAFWNHAAKGRHAYLWLILYRSLMCSFLFLAFVEYLSSFAFGFATRVIDAEYFWLRNGVGDFRLIAHLVILAPENTPSATFCLVHSACGLVHPAFLKAHNFFSSFWFNLGFSG